MALSTGKVVALIQAMGGGADPAVIEAAVQDWLDNHPEATTTVQDGSITEQKLATAVAQKLGLISSLSDEIDGIDSDVTDLKSAINVFSFDAYKTQSDRFVYSNDSKVYPNDSEGFVLKAYKIKAGLKYACLGSVLNPYRYSFGLVLMGIYYTDTDVSLSTDTVFNFAHTITADTNTYLTPFSYYFEAQSNGYIIALEVEDAFSTIAISSPDLTTNEQNDEPIKYVLENDAVSTLSDAFIYNVGNKVYVNYTQGFVLKAYKIHRGMKYSFSGDVLTDYAFNEYSIVLLGLVYTDSEINLSLNATFNFSYKISINKKELFSHKEYFLNAEDDGYIIVTNVTDHYKSRVFSQQYIEPVSPIDFEQTPHKLTNLFTASFSSSEFQALNDWTVANGKLSTTTASITNMAVVNKSFSIEDRTTAIRFKTSDSSAKIGFGYKTTTYVYGSTLCYVDFSAGKMAICESFISDSMPNDRVNKNITLTANREYIAVLEKVKKKNVFTIVDTLSGDRQTIETVSETTDTLLNEFAGGRQNGSPFAVLLSGSNVEITEWYITTPFDTPRIAVYGDSITEGDRLTNDQMRFADHLKNDFGYYDVSVSGMSGSNIDTVTAQITDEIPHTKPKIVIVGIGTNGTLTEEKLTNLKNIIEGNGSIAIFDHIPMLAGTTAQSQNAIIDLINTNHALMDVATAVNNNISSGKNSALYADSIHPNVNGHLAMYKRFIIDTSIYHN